MSVEQLQKEIVTLRASVRDLESKVALLQRERSSGSGLLRPPLSDEEKRVFDDIDAYGRFYRLTGRDDPGDWKPGDPLPEPVPGWYGEDVETPAAR